MSLFENKPTNRPEKDDGFLIWEDRQKIWADTDHIKYSDFMEKLYNDKEYYQLIEDIRDAEWWKNLQDGKLKPAIFISPAMKKIVVKEWPDIQEDINFFYRDLRLLRNQSRNTIRDSLSNFYMDHLETIELLMLLACMQIFMELYTKNNSQDIQLHEDLIEYEGINHIRKSLGFYFSMADQVQSIVFNDVFVFLLNGAQKTYDQDGREAIKTRDLKPPKKDDGMPSFREI